LPSAVAAVIEEHHADSVMEAFLEQARARMHDGNRDAVDEQAFRYRGRRPHSKESALVMLADQIESAARAMKDDASLSRVDAVVDHFVNRALTAGLLTVCDLSLRELERARMSLKEALTGMLRGELHRHGSHAGDGTIGTDASASADQIEGSE
jgi:membrane-associated HD superfamily phosphohydrolase